MREGGPRGLEMTSETAELLRSPERVFDSDFESAQKEARELLERLERIGETDRNNERVRFKTQEFLNSQVPQIQVDWPVQKGAEATMLQLTPHVDGHGNEQGIFGYSGQYGTTKGESNLLEFAGEPISLKELFGVPDDLEIVVVPTADRWAIEKNGLLSLIYGENTCTLYMGIGFLFRGPEFMQIGMHEAGHLAGGEGQTHTSNENEAWTYANQRYARIHKPKKTQVLAGQDTGLFRLLKKPQPYSDTRTIGKIAQYGLVSHAMSGGNAHIPQQWERRRDNIMRELRNVIEMANEDYEYFIGR